MDYYTLDIDVDGMELLIDVLAAAIALAERDDDMPESSQVINLISVGTPHHECLRRVRAIRPPKKATSIDETPRIVPQGRRRTLL